MQFPVTVWALPADGDRVTHSVGVSVVVVDPHSIPGLFVGQRRRTRGDRQPMIVPESVLDRHLLITGQTGSGKSTTATQAIRTCHATTDGATIVIDPKGDGWPAMIGRSLYADRCELGSKPASEAFDDVLYFDANAGLPRLPLFDIRPALAAGVNRIDAAEAVIDDTLTLLSLLFPGVDDAVRSPDVITNLMLALFDPKHGSDAFGISDLYEAAIELSASRSVPRVSVEWLQHLLDGTTDGPQRVFGAIQQGVKTRLSKLLQDPYLRSMCDSVDTDGFRMTDYLDEDVLIVLDVSALTPRAQQVVTHVILRHLWRGLEWRQASLAPGEDPAQVSLWIDEVPQLEIKQELSQLLAMGRGLGLSVVPMLQFPQQLQEGTGGDRVFQELLNNIGSVLCGHLDTAPQLAETLATRQTPAADVRDLLRSCPDDRWVFSPAADRSLESKTSPLMVIDDPPLPPGHPDGSVPLSPKTRDAFERVWSECRQRTLTEFGVAPEGYRVIAAEQSADTNEIDRGLTHTLWLDSVTLPDGVGYSYDADQLYCTDCGTAYLPQFGKLQEALTHCRPASDPSTAELPVTDIGLADVDPARVNTSALTLRELMFLRLIERAERRDIHPLEWDVTEESMLRLRNTVGLNADDQAAIVEDGYIAEQPDFRGAFYWLTPKGRNALDEIRGGNGPSGTQLGDPSESAAHIRLVEVAASVLESLTEKADNPIENVERYWSHPDQREVIDVVAVDGEGTPCIAVEGERSTHDLPEAAAADYDAMAGLESTPALWIVPNRATGHKVVSALVEPADGTARLDMSPADIAAETTVLNRYDFESAGCADIVTVSNFDERVVLDALSE